MLAQKNGTSQMTPQKTLSRCNNEYTKRTTSAFVAESLQKEKTPKKIRAASFVSPPEMQIHHICSRGLRLNHDSYMK